MQEINLLPPERRKLLRNESIAISLHGFLKSINAGLMLLTVIGVALIVGLMIMSYAAARTTSQELQAMVDEYQNLRDIIAEQNKVFEYVAAVGRDRIVWSTIIRDFVGVVPPGVQIHTLAGRTVFAEGAVSSAQISFKGQAITRSTLVIYEERLKALESVISLTSPTSNLLERNNPTFEFDIDIRTTPDL